MADDRDSRQRATGPAAEYQLQRATWSGFLNRMLMATARSDPQAFERHAVEAAEWLETVPRVIGRGLATGAVLQLAASLANDSRAAGDDEVQLPEIPASTATSEAEARDRTALVREVVTGIRNRDYDGILTLLAFVDESQLMQLVVDVVQYAHCSKVVRFRRYFEDRRG